MKVHLHTCRKMSMTLLTTHFLLGLCVEKTKPRKNTAVKIETDWTYTLLNDLTTALIVIHIPHELLSTVKCPRFSQYPNK